jgi:hypothetical protein
MMMASLGATASSRHPNPVPAPVLYSPLRRGGSSRRLMTGWFRHPASDPTKNLLTTRIGCAMVKSSKDFQGVSRMRSGIFYANFRPLLHARVEKASVSAYREVCGKRPWKLVENTGALSFLRSESLQNIIQGGSI